MDRHPNTPPSSRRPAGRSPASTLVSLAYVLGLILVFSLSLYLLPANTGLGKLLWGS